MLLLIGKLLRSIALTVPLLAVALELWEQAVFVGAADGQIFEVPLSVTQHSLSAGSTRLAASSLEEQGIHLLTGHTAAVNSLAMTSGGYHLVSGLALMSRHLSSVQKTYFSSGIAKERCLWTEQKYRAT